MKKHIPSVFISLFILGLVLSGCRDKYTEEYYALDPIYMSFSDLRASVKMVNQQDLVKPGKIYTFGNYIFINEVKKGVHVYNNSNPTTPQYVGFLNIPGNIDMVVKNNILYADSYVDLVAIDIADPSHAKEIGRVKNVFYYDLPAKTEPGYQTSGINYNLGIVVDWELKHVSKETYARYTQDGFMQINTKLDALASVAPGSGAGGSMARFGLTGNSLVAIGKYYGYNLYYNFDLTEPGNPKLLPRFALRPGVETMFLAGKNMFLGTANGMDVYDLSDPVKPVYLSTFWHATGCDPVVVQNNKAYVTLRSGVTCANRSTNELSVLDITDVKVPVLLRSYGMDNPHGLGISDDILFVCDGNSGLKVYNAANPLLIAENLLAKFPGINAYDVIPLGKSLLMIGSDGFYQYDYSDLTNIKQISVIPVKK